MLVKVVGREELGVCGAGVGKPGVLDDVIGRALNFVVQRGGDVQLEVVVERGVTLLRPRWRRRRRRVSAGP